MKLARSGANIAINYLSREQDALEAKQAVEQEGAKCLLVQGDVSDPEGVQRVVAGTRDAFGPIGLLVLSAGLSILESHQDISWETWKRTMSINRDGVFLPIMAVKDEMLAERWGRVVCISSVAALPPAGCRYTMHPVKPRLSR